MDKEFNLLSYGNLPGIEQTSGKRIASSSACKAEISLCAVLPFDRFEMAIWALFHLKRIDELYLVNRKWLMLFIVLSFAFVRDEGWKRKCPVKFRKCGPQREPVFVLQFFHGGLCAHRKGSEDTNRQVIGFVSLPMNPIFTFFKA